MFLSDDSETTMKRLRIICMLLAAMVLGGCVGADAPVVTETGNVDPASGNLIAFWMEDPDGNVEPFLVTEPYGALMVWLDGKKRFFVYENETLQTFRTTDFDQFLAKLGELPRDVAVQTFAFCTVPRTYDMPEAARLKLRETMRSRGLTWTHAGEEDGHRFIICYCESMFHYP